MLAYECDFIQNMGSMTVFLLHLKHTVIIREELTVYFTVLQQCH